MTSEITTRRYDRLFFPLMGAAFLLVALAGFWTSFFVQVAQVENQFSSAILFHAIVMFTWLGVFILQALLPSAGRIRLHKRLGYASIALFLAVWASSVTISISSFTDDYSAEIRTLINNLFFLQIVAWFLAPVLFYKALVARLSAPTDHKRYLLLLTFFLIEAAASRLSWLPGMSSEKYWIVFQYLYLDIFLVILVAYDFSVLGRLAKATKIGLAIFVTYQLVAVMVWDSKLWLTVANHLLALLLKV